jgi:outer membrane receptor protein involved in Fe transport
VPCEFQPDKTENYDLGIKGDFFNHLISLDGSVYYINWKDIQVGESSGVSDYYANGSRAKSQGVELALESRPITGSNVQAWVAWNDAILTDAFPAASTVYGVAGDRLPFSAKFSGNVSVQQTFSLSNRVSVFISAAEAYVGQRVGGFPTSGGITSSLIRQSFPAYAQTDLRTGVILDSLSLNLSATNITNRLGELSGGLGGINPYAFQFTQPRTIGLSVIKTF